MLRRRKERSRTRRVPGPEIRRLAPAHHPRDARPLIPGHHRPPRQKKRAETGQHLTSRNEEAPENPATPDPPPIRRRLIALTLAEIRRLLHIHRDQRDDQTKIAHALHWSKWRRAHQTHARRCHFRRRLRLQALMI